MSKGPWPWSDLPTIGDYLDPDPRDAEIARLKAELEALKPVPAAQVIFVEMRLSDVGSYRSLRISCPTHRREIDNLKLTFHDGILHSAEVINA